MVNSSWGVKRTCPCGNGVRFYDLNKKEIECPSCGESINIKHLSISNIENNLRKKPQAQIVEEKTVVKTKKSKKLAVEIDTDDNPDADVKEIISDKIKDKEKE